MPVNIYITGFMGCGKSRVGSELAKNLGRPFVDTDTRFRTKYGIEPGTCILAEGEENFRRKEHILLRELSEECEMAVISTGGGIPAWRGNHEIMSSNGIVVFIDVPLAVIETRLSASAVSGRPLWSADNAELRQKRYQERQPAYRKANFIVNAAELTPSECVSEIMRQTAQWRSAAPLKSRSFRKLRQEVAKSCADYHLLEPGDRILAGISGGEDSLMMMHLLESLRRRLPFKIEIIPAVVDMQLPGFELKVLQEYARAQGWQLQTAVVPNGAEIFRAADAGERPCPLCSRLRRGQLHRLMDELQCNKLALGQHLTDLCASFLISLCRGGGLKTMGPNVPADGGKARLIRPLWSITKSTIHNCASLFAFPHIRSCPYEKALEEDGDRARMERLIAELERDIPDLQSSMRQSMGDIRLAHLLDRRFAPDDGKNV